jgi:tetratricopeptide (TPR) repeat protein
MKKNILLLLLSLFAFLIANHALAGGPDELFFQANQAYKSGNYLEAGKLYSEFAGHDPVSGHIYYNLGNTRFRQDDLGGAILNYERARILIPRDADLLFNLGYAKDRTRDAVAPAARPFSTIFFWLDSFSLSEVFILFAMVNALFFTALVLRLTLGHEWTFSLLITMLVVWSITGPSLGVKWYQTVADSRAVVLAPEVSVLAGPDPTDTEFFKLHAGTVIRTERSEGGWTLIRIADDKRGWVKKDSIGFVVKSKG